MLMRCWPDAALGTTTDRGKIVQSWIKFVPTEEAVQHEDYFIGRRRNIGDPYHEACDLLCKGLDGKQIWGSKPGIAIRAELDDGLRMLLNRHPDWALVAIPADAAKRWKARKRRF